MPTHCNHSPQIWFAKIETESVIFQQQVLGQLSTSERQRLDKIKNNDRRQEYLLSRALMRHALSEQFNQRPQQWQFVEGANAPPTVLNLPKGHWLSLSHSHGRICFVIHTNPVGIDMEQGKTRANFSTLAKAFMTEHELQWLDSNPLLKEDNFYKVWCAKEAFYKITSAIDQQNLFLKKIDYFGLIQSKKHHLIQGKIDDYHLALVSKSTLENPHKLQARSFHGRIPIQWHS